jgi:hypothetical protein
MKPTSFITINQRNYTFLDQKGFDVTSADHNILFDLSYLSALEVKGDHGRDFLQGQQSADIRKLTSQNMQSGALCNLQGRIIALMDILTWNHLFLVLPHDLQQLTQKILSKPAAFSRVTLAPSTHSIFGFKLNQTQDLMPFDWTLPHEKHGVIFDERGLCYHVGHQSYVLMIPSIHQDALKNPFIQAQQLQGSFAWHKQRLQEGHIEIYSESSGLFLPHRLDLHKTDYLSFDKGCYRGQEIIARTHYRATLKHTLKQFTITTKTPLQSGLKIMSIDGTQEIGEIIDFYAEENHQYTIAASILLEHPNRGRVGDQEIFLESLNKF